MVIFETNVGINKRAWTNLVDYAYDTFIDSTLVTEAINVELQKFNAVTPVGRGYLEFETEEDAIQFILTWS
jgi:hypothetical protein